MQGNSANFYENNGFIVLKNLFQPREFAELRECLDAFHLHWIDDNKAFYQQHAINSHSLTGLDYLAPEQKNTLFSFIAQDKLIEPLTEVIGTTPAFVGTQLFFDPVNPNKRNYWHRDIQYDNDLAGQKAILGGPEMLHCRIALEDENGIELVPGSHLNWDTEEELSVRTESNGKHNFDDLSSGMPIPLDAGDVLIFSAVMIHRGLYGKERFAFDILYCEPVPELLRFTQPDGLPKATDISKFSNPVFSTCQLEL